MNQTPNDESRLVTDPRQQPEANVSALLPSVLLSYTCAGKLVVFLNAKHGLMQPGDCGARNEIKPREPIRCRECGHRILYKERRKGTGAVDRF